MICLYWFSPLGLFVTYGEFATHFLDIWNNYTVKSHFLWGFVNSKCKSLDNSIKEIYPIMMSITFRMEENSFIYFVSISINNLSSNGEYSLC